MISAATSQKYDLEERTARFGEDVIKFCQRISKSTIVNPLIEQLIKAATSVGANYCEADNAESKKDFKHKIGICKKEARETKHWLRMTVVAVPDLTEEARKLWQEGKELNLCFYSLSNKFKNRN